MGSALAKILTADEVTTYLAATDQKQLWEPERQLGSFPYSATVLSLEAQKDVQEDLLGGVSAETNAVGAQDPSADVSPDLHCIYCAVFLAFVVGNLSGAGLTRFLGKHGTPAANALQEPLLAGSVA